MRISDLSWKQLEEIIDREDRVVLPLGSTEQHAGLSLSTDSILADRMAAEAAEPLGVPVFPVLHYGITPYFAAYPGTVSLRIETYLRLVGDILDNFERMGFRRVLMVNGHGGNAPAASFAVEWASRHAGMRVKVHNWWNAPETLATLRTIDPVGSHASWSENFPWTRLVDAPVDAPAAPEVDRVRMSALDPAEVRAALGDGNMGGVPQRPDEDVLALWAAGVAETRAQIEGPWS